MKNIHRRFLSLCIPACGVAVLAVVALSGCGGPEENPADGDAQAGAAVEEDGVIRLENIDPANPRPLTPEEQKLVVDEIMRVKARQQAAGLGGGEVTVNGAWEYGGWSYLAPDPNAPVEVRLVAVDVSFSGHTEHFDIDDVEIVDGASLISYGSDPHAEPLRLDGSLMPAGELPAPPPGESRWLLIYAFPKQSPTLRLEYWHQELTPDPIEIGAQGLELPYPKE